jgi:hypothetical protein
MSIRAGEFYAITADVCGLEVPQILNGNVFLLGDPKARLPIHMKDDWRTEERRNAIADDHEAAVRQAAEFLAGATAHLFPGTPTESNAGYASMFGTLSRNAFERIVPKDIAAGHLRDFTVEAIMREELPAGTPQHFQDISARRASTSVPEGEAYLLASAELFSGRLLGRVGCITQVAVQGVQGYTRAVFAKIFRPPALYNTNLKTNEMLALSGLWQSSAIGRVVQGDRLSKPASAGLPGANRDSHGTGG